MKQSATEINISTKGRGFIEVSGPIRDWVDRQGIKTGLLTIFIKHTSASLLIQENADSDVLLDMETFFRGLVKDGDHRFRHTLEGPDDMSAHIRCALTQTHLSIPVLSGRISLGTWQGIYIYEHRTSRQNRVLTLHLLGE
jgi:secondary thiamine-phosphate synthase enzyme